LLGRGLESRPHILPPTARQGLPASLDDAPRSELSLQLYDADRRELGTPLSCPPATRTRWRSSARSRS